MAKWEERDEEDLEGGGVAEEDDDWFGGFEGFEGLDDCELIITGISN